MKKAFAILIALIILCGIMPTLTAADSGITVSLTNAGTADASSFEHARFTENGIIAEVGGKYQILDYTGKNVLGETYDYVEPFINDTWLVYQTDKGANCCGLVKADGTVVVSVSAAIIDDMEGSRRFIEIVYATEPVTDQSAAYLFAYERIAALTPEEGDQLYAGYSLYFDMERGQFVGDLRRTDTAEANSVYAVGDKLFFDHRDTIYDSNGEVFASFSGSVWGGREGRCFSERGDDGNVTLFDPDMKKIATFPDDPDESYFGYQLFAIEDDEAGADYVCDRNETRIGELSFNSIPYVCGGFLYGEDMDSHLVVMDTSGKTVISADAGVSYADSLPYGFLKLTFEDGKYGLLYPDGTIVKGADNNWDLLFFQYEQGNSMLILDQKDFVEMEESFSSVDDSGIFFTSTVNNVETLFSVVNGEALFKNESGDSDAFHYAGGYLYVLQGSVYEIYRVEVSG